jgi:hypothetical protein
LNRLFDEDNNEYYVGYDKEITNIHNQTNNTARIINIYNKYATRKNKEKTYFPKIKNNNENYSVNYINETHYKRKTQSKSSSNLKNRKSRIETRPASTYTENNINLSLLKPNNNTNNNVNNINIK